MNPYDYEFLSNFLLNTSGLALGEHKEYLLTSRLEPVAERLGLRGVAELVKQLRRGGDASVSAAVIEAMTTNETLFFRDVVPFTELRTQFLPPLVQARAQERKLRIWCAAASTGQEPYSIAMTLYDHFPALHSWDVEIVGTDISPQALERSKTGSYTYFEVQRGLPEGSLKRHFEQIEGGWQVKECLRKLMTFRELNLLENFQFLGPFDIIFCRNVLIYFEVATKAEIVKKMASVLREDGVFVLGAAETVLGLSEEFSRWDDCRSAAYRPVRGLAAPRSLASGTATATYQGMLES